MKRILRKSVVTSLSIVTIGMLSFGAFANEADVQYRKATMSALGGHVRALGAVVQGKVSHDEDLILHARAIGDLGKIVPHIFPKGSEGDGTKAKSAIWENPDEFQKAVDGFVSASGKIGSAADKSAVAAALGELANSCKTCHSTFKD